MHIKKTTARRSSIQPMALLLLLPALATSGCSLRLPGRDLAMGYAAERTGAEQRVVGGLDLRIGGGWPGFNAGFGSTTISTPAPTGEISSENTNSRSRYEPPLGWTWSRSGVVHHAGWFHRASQSPTGAVQFIAESKLGLGVGWHPAASSFDLGFGRQTLVIAQPDAHGTFLVDFTSRRPLDGGVTRIRTNQNDIPAP